MTLRTGKLAPKRDYRTLRMGAYLAALLPPAPETWDTMGTVLKNLGQERMFDLFPMDWNDIEGDCTKAAVAHAITVYNGLLGRRVVPAADAVQAEYRAMTGGADTGLYEIDVLRDWRKNGALGDAPIGAFAGIDPKNHEHVRQAIRIFGGCYLGFQVQQDCLADFQAVPRRAWTPGPLLPEGHAVYAVSYGPDGVDVLTWGDIQHGSWAWWDACVDEAWAIMPAEALQPGFYDGLDSDALRADLAQLGIVVN